MTEDTKELERVNRAMKALIVAPIEAVRYAIEHRTLPHWALEEICFARIKNVKAGPILTNLGDKPTNPAHSPAALVGKRNGPAWVN